MNPLLMVMNPRNIPECVQAIEDLSIDQAWLTGYTEDQLVRIIPQVLENTEHSHYLILADDCIPTQAALDAVLGALREGHPVATGYCNLDTAQHADTYNITRAPLTTPRTIGSYQWWTQQHVDQHDGDLLPTTFAGFALTGMTRQLWEQYPFQCEGNPGAASDWCLSLRLQTDGVPIVAPRAARVHHVKTRWNEMDSHPSKRLLIGEIPPRVELR